MRTDYALAITEDEAALRREERRVRGRPTAVRVRALRLLKGGAARTLEACADLVGHSPRQVARGGRPTAAAGWRRCCGSQSGRGSRRA